MTIHFRQGKLEEAERQAILEEVYQQAKAAARGAVKAVVEALLEGIEQLVRDGLNDLAQPSQPA